MHTRLLTAVLAMATAVAFASCGATTAPTAPGASSSAGTPVTVTAADGKTVTLTNGPAQRVVALEWEYGEILTTLGAGSTVVGLSDISGYTSYVAPTVPLLGSPADVGERLEPSVEAIADLQPDVIVASDRSIPDAVRGQLDAIAPVLVLNMDAGDDRLQAVKNTTATLGTLVGADAAAAQWSTQLDDTLKTNAGKITTAGVAGQHAVFAYVSAEGSTASIRLHVPGSAVEAVLAGMGMKPAWTDDSAEAGLTYLDVEGLTRLPADTWFLYWDEDTDPIATNLGDNRVWTSLPFVKDGRLHGVAKGVWIYGGPQSLIAFSNQATTVLTQQ